MLQDLAQHDQGDDVLLTEASWGPRRDGGWSSTMAVRQRRAALVEEAAAGALRTPRLHGSMRGAPAKVLRGSGMSGDHRRRGIARAEHLTGGGFGFNSGTARAQGRGQKLHEASWRRGGATAGDVVAWGATGAGKEGGGGAGDLRGCRAGVRVLGLRKFLL
jgi:hypothetical protein